MSDRNDILIANLREKGNEVTTFLESEGIDVRYTNLRLIDYLIAGRIAIIRRTVDAFLADLSNKQLYRSAPEFKRSFPDPIYIVEGASPAARISATTPGRAGVTYLTFVNRIPIIFASTPEESAKYIALMMKQAEFAAAPAETLSMEDVSEMPAESADGALLDSGVTIEVLKLLPDVSEEIAGRLLAKFGSLRAVFSAEEKELAAVKGLSAKRAKMIVDFIATGAKEPVTKTKKSASTSR